MIRCKSWLALLLISVAVVGCMKARTPRWYIFAEGFEGWVWINYEIENADPLPVNEDAEVLNIPECGVLSTSSPIIEGFARDRYFFRKQGTSLDEIDVGRTRDHERDVLHPVFGRRNGRESYQRFFFGSPLSSSAEGKPPGSSEEVLRLNCGLGANP